MDAGIREGIQRCLAEIERLEGLRNICGPDPEIESALGARKEELARWREIAAQPRESFTSRDKAAMRDAHDDAPAPTSCYPLPDLPSVEAQIESLGGLNNANLRAVLDELCSAVHPRAETRIEYDEARPRIFAAHSLMTWRNSLAPAVRPMARLPGFLRRADLVGVYRLMLNDRQMFDLEYAHKHKLGKPKRRWETLLRSEAFNRDLAAEFVSTVGKTEHKLDAAHFREDEQMTLCAIRTDAVRKRWERLEHDADALEDYLEAQRAFGACKIAKEDVQLWREEYIALEIAGGSPGGASVVLKRIYGRARPANQLANRKIDLKRKMLSMTKAAA
ncbi:MAG TPA: hypothetical protein VMK12_11385 [Anaeromyxobacteraceae bacterium]|nr:hypothetical protein [Anaeromyxobacteraceae bacterium]